MMNVGEKVIVVDASESDYFSIGDEGYIKEYDEYDGELPYLVSTKDGVEDDWFKETSVKPADTVESVKIEAAKAVKKFLLINKEDISESLHKLVYENGVDPFDALLIILEEL